jgi:Phospholipase_D-nuclease N-terminal
MANNEWWASLTEGQRNAIKVLAAGELTLKILMLIDISRRPASQIRGPKGVWRAAAAVNLLGPAAYFLFGRRGPDRGSVRC